MDKDHFSIFELLYYTKEFEYMTIEVVEDGVPSGFLCGTVGDQSSNVVGENSNVGENISTVHDLNVEGSHEVPTQTDNIDIESGVDELSDLEGVETDLDNCTDSQEFNIP
ncbi:hypothetical protein BC332_17108 [Capsicum chinense]|nr:hypothetical protein BC332_17108 [Capsicum chinense]